MLKMERGLASKSVRLRMIAGYRAVGSGADLLSRERGGDDVNGRPRPSASFSSGNGTATSIGTWRHE